MRSMGFPYPGYAEDWSATLWLNPGPLGLTVWIKVYRAGGNKRQLHVPDYSVPFNIANLYMVGPAIIAKIRRSLKPTASPA